MKGTKRITSILLVLAMILCSTVIVPSKAIQAEETTTKDSWVDPGNYTRGWYDSVTDLDVYGNTGTEEDPYEIKSAKDLAGLAYYSNIISTDSATTDFGGKYISIIAETIDLSAHYWFPIGTVQNFKGTVEGNNVVIKNMYIGRADKYETCAKVGLFGTLYAAVKNIAIQNAVIYSNSAQTGGFVGAWLGGNINNCSVEGIIYRPASSSTPVGGFIGYHATNGLTIKDCFTSVKISSTTSSGIGGFVGNNSAVTTYENCYATEDVIGGASCTIGGFAGYNINGTFLNCYARGNVTGNGTGCSAGGFIGNSEIGTQKQCFATGNVKTSGGNTGGFIGKIRNNSVYNSYALGNVESGASSNVAGFIGYSWNNWTNVYFPYSGNYDSVGSYNSSSSQYGCNINIENCYSAGSTKAGANSTVAGFFGGRQYDFSKITFKKNYWNLSQNQVINGTYRANTAKVAVAYAESRTTVGAYSDYMKSSEFVSDLNEYVYQNSESYNTWEIAENVNNGYPYITGNKSALFSLTGDSKDLTLDSNSQEATNDMSVYGTVIFPSPSAGAEEPEEPDTSVSVGLSWGSLDFVYTAGEYNEETDSYAEGTWEPKEEGVTDKVTITNKSEEDLQVAYAFQTSTEGNFTNLVGRFYREDRETEITEAVPVRAMQGDIVSIQNVFLEIEGVPNEEETITTPEVIGTVLVSVTRYEEENQEPEIAEPETTESANLDSEGSDNEDSDTEAAESQTPAVDEPVATEESVVTEEPLPSNASPEATEETIQEETPVESTVPSEEERIEASPVATESTQEEESTSEQPTVTQETNESSNHVEGTEVETTDVE